MVLTRFSLELIKGLDKDAFEAHVILPNDGVLVAALENVGAKSESH
mgnify:CR=1 FL=1